MDANANANADPAQAMDPAEYEIIAQQGEGRYVLVPRGTVDPSTRRACILDATHKRIFPPQPLQSILAQGYWEDYNGNQADLATMLDGVQPVGPRHIYDNLTKDGKP